MIVYSIRLVRGVVIGVVNVVTVLILVPLAVDEAILSDVIPIIPICTIITIIMTRMRVWFVVLRHFIYHSMPAIGVLTRVAQYIFGFQQISIAHINLALIVGNPCTGFYPLCIILHMVMPVIRSLDGWDPLLHIFPFFIVM
jgi:hypothetical protein